MKKKTCISFIDLEKAFDRIKRNKLQEVVGDQYYNIPPKFIRIMKSIYRNRWSRVKNRGIEITKFEIKIGVR